MPRVALSEHSKALDLVRLRLHVSWHRARLDAALADGADPADDPALAFRASELAALPTRVGIANALRHVVDAAEEPADAWRAPGPRPPLQRHEILAARGELLALADRLAVSLDVSTAAAALAAVLVWDSASPLYAPHPEASVRQWAQTVLDMLALSAS